jgi:hypothetical protein
MLMYGARTGRNPVEELRRTWPPDTDSARLIIGTILRGMQALAEPTPDELAAALLSASDADRQAAQRVLADIIYRNGVPASDSLRSELLVPLLDSIARGANTPWLPSPGGDARLHPYLVDFHGVNDVPVFVLDSELPRFVTAVLPSRFTLITRDAWTARPQREGGALITFLPTRVWHDFVVVGWDWTVFERRAANEAPSGYAGGGSYILLRTPSGWRVVYTSGWIT